MTRIKMQADSCGCLELWHEHADAPIGSVPMRGPDGLTTHWVRFVDMIDRLACPHGDCEVIGEPSLLVGRVEGHEEAS